MILDGTDERTSSTFMMNKEIHVSSMIEEYLRMVPVGKKMVSMLSAISGVAKFQGTEEDNSQ